MSRPPCSQRCDGDWHAPECPNNVSCRESDYGPKLKLGMALIDALRAENLSEHFSDRRAAHAGYKLGLQKAIDVVAAHLQVDELVSAAEITEDLRALRDI